MGNLSLELILSDKVQELLDHFAKVLDLRLTFYDASGNVLRRGLKMRNCEYCRIVQEELGELTRCMAMDSDKRNEAVQQTRVITYTCHAGLGEAIAPVVIENETVGFLMIGQYRTGNTPPDLPPTHRWADCRLQLQKAFYDLPQLDNDKLNAVLGMFTMFLDYLIARELATLRGTRLKHELERYIDSHLTEKLRLPAVAKRLGRSVSSLAHELKTRYDTSFSELLISRRLSRAEELMQKYPKRSIAEISLAVGIDDPYYFSRLYKKYRGTPPSAFRKSPDEAAASGHADAKA